jgi:hypothetical protein
MGFEEVEWKVVEGTTGYKRGVIRMTALESSSHLINTLETEMQKTFLRKNEWQRYSHASTESAARRG